jgi:elongation factor G
MKKGPLAGFEIVGCKMCLDDGSYHSVDSSEMAFRTAGRDAFIEAFKKSRPCLLEPIMTVEIEMPGEFQGPVVGDLNSRRGIIMGTEARNNYTVVRAEVPLANMFGYATVIRGMTRGTGTFTMEMSRYARVPAKISELILEQHREQKEQPARK